MHQNANTMKKAAFLIGFICTISTLQAIPKFYCSWASVGSFFKSDSIMCRTCDDCRSQAQFTNSLPHESAQLSASPYLQKLDSCITFPFQIDSCVTSNTGLSAPNRGWALACSFQNGDLILTIKNTGSVFDTALVNFIDGQSTTFPLSNNQAIVPLAPGSSAILYYGNLNFTVESRIIVASASEIGSDGTGMIVGKIPASSIPTASQWGLGILILLILSLGINLIQNEQHERKWKAAID